jgi:hypothetical protein
MLRKLALCAMGVVFAGAVTCQSDQTAIGKQEPTKHSQQKQTDGQSGQPQTTAQVSTGDTALQGSKVWWRDSNWWLVIVALITAGVIGWQSFETRKAAQAARDSIRIQEAEFFQWLDISDWEVENLDGKKGGWSRSGTEIQNHPGAMNFRISFPLINNTPRPLFIHSVSTKLEIGSEKVKKEFLVEEALQVPPKSEYKVVIDTEFTHDNVTEWLTLSVPILGVVDVWFSNALGEKDEARFERLVTSRWGPDGETRTISKGRVATQVDA